MSSSRTQQHRRFVPSAPGPGGTGANATPVKGGGGNPWDAIRDPPPDAVPGRAGGAGGMGSTAQERRRERELNEARKAGTAAPLRDAVDGSEINPHIPQFISSAPWYLKDERYTGPTLQHQRAAAPPPATSIHADVPGSIGKARRAPAATRYRKGACENCGALTHRTLDCVERPRRRGAKWTPDAPIAPDEPIPPTPHHADFAGKRDRWNGYDPAEHLHVVEHWELVEAERERLAAIALQEKLAKEASAPTPTRPLIVDSESDSDDVEQGAEDDAEAAPKGDAKTRTTVRNLRLREDRPKYLMNLDPDSAYYNPKSRSMREDPGTAPLLQGLPYAGDAFVRDSGDAASFNDMRLFAWNTATEAHANPTEAERLHRAHLAERHVQRTAVKRELLDRYGGAEHFLDPAAAARLPSISTDDAPVTYTVQPPPTASIEEKNPGNHTDKWGSYEEDGKLGYACCHQLMRAAYCTGGKGREMREQERRVDRIAAGIESPVKNEDEAEVLQSETITPRKKKRKERASKESKTAKRARKDVTEEVTEENPDTTETLKEKTEAPVVPPTT